MVRERTKAKSISGEFATAQSTLFVREISSLETWLFLQPWPFLLTQDGDSVESIKPAASHILNKFPRGAAALTRVCIQNMMPLLKENAKNLDENISSLVRKGLEVEIQLAMDVLQVVRKNRRPPKSI
jgi:hypothetical protein